MNHPGYIPFRLIIIINISSIIIIRVPMIIPTLVESGALVNINRGQQYSSTILILCRHHWLVLLLLLLVVAAAAASRRRRHCCKHRPSSCHGRAVVVIVERTPSMLQNSKRQIQQDPIIMVEICILFHIITITTVWFFGYLNSPLFGHKRKK